MRRIFSALSLLILALISAPAVADEDIFKIGVEALNKKDYRFAILCFNDVLVKDPKNSEAFYYRGLAQNGKGFIESAMKNFEEAIRLNPKLKEALIARGNLYVEQDEYDKAIQDHYQAILLDPKYALANISRGSSYGRMKNYRAVEDFNSAIRLSPYDPRPYIERGNAYLDGGKLEEGIQDLSQGIRLNYWQDLALYERRAGAYAKKGEYEKAIDDYNQIILIDPKNSNAYFNRSAVYHQKGDSNRAIEDWLKGIQLMPPFNHKVKRSK
jgi:tetratricopeptide (TPR) repeat protein